VNFFSARSAIFISKVSDMVTSEMKKSRDILALVQMCKDYITCRLQFIDKSFGNEIFLREIEEDLLDVAAGKTKMKRISSFHDLKLLRERINLRSHLGGAMELKVALDGLIRKYTNCYAIAQDVISTMQLQLIPSLRLLKITPKLCADLHFQVQLLSNLLLEEEELLNCVDQVQIPISAARQGTATFHPKPNAYFPRHSFVIRMMTYRMSDMVMHRRTFILPYSK
jgi:hypothetical protein